MYQRHNDYELIYLIKEGEEEALKEIFKKYEHFLHKLHFERRIKRISRTDFLQEGFMILQRAIQSYNSLGTISFYTYFNICLKRRLCTLYNQLSFKEECNIEFNRLSDKNNYNNYLSRIIKRELYNADKELADIFFDCVIRGMPLKTYCRLYNKKYEIIYYKYKKLLRDLRKKVD